jgi:hypothetical protein
VNLYFGTILLIVVIVVFGYSVEVVRAGPSVLTIDVQVPTMHESDQCVKVVWHVEWKGEERFLHDSSDLARLCVGWLGRLIVRLGLGHQPLIHIYISIN